MIELEIKIKISDDDIKEAIGTINGFYGIELKEEHIKEMCEKDLSWAADWINAGFDTVVREHSVSVFCRFVLGIMPFKWPTYGHNAQYKETFYTALVKGCEKKGIKCGKLEEYLK